MAVSCSLEFIILLVIVYDFFSVWPSKSGIYIYINEDFPVVMYGCESWTVKKAERRRIDAFELWCWRSGEDC